ncbi:MAG: hypothetical protein AB7P04_06985 [Bacteriovoracia bacterium]
MVLLDEAIAGKKFDTRLVEKNVNRSVVKSTDVDTFLKGLPDDSENATWVSLDALAADDTDRPSAGMHSPEYK